MAKELEDRNFIDRSASPKNKNRLVVGTKINNKKKIKSLGYNISD